MKYYGILYHFMFSDYEMWFERYAAAENIKQAEKEAILYFQPTGSHKGHADLWYEIPDGAFEIEMIRELCCLKHAVTGQCECEKSVDIGKK